MKKVIIGAVALVASFTMNAQDLESKGSNSWLFHTPDDGRTSLHIVPKIDGNWSWTNEFKFLNDGTMFASKLRAHSDITAPHIESINDLVAGGGLVAKHDLYFAGGNDWVLHTPGETSGSLHFAPKIDGDWSWGKQVYFTKDADVIVDGKIGIGTRNPDSKLTVNGTIHSKEVRVDLQIPADYVFEKYYEGASTLKADYKMPTLEEVEAFTKKNHHLPAIPSAAKIQEEGLHLKEMTNLLLQKIEELTLYTIEQEKRIKTLEKKLATK